jgi:Domain of Unknown Function (DUF928)
MAKVMAKRLIHLRRFHPGYEPRSATLLSRLAIALTLGLLIFPGAQAAEPAGPQPLFRANAAARRCDPLSPVSLTALTPPDHAATTLSDHPTFLWQVSGPSHAPMQFTLMAPGRHEPIYQQTLKADRSGVVALTLPESAAALELGQQYRWTVALVCDADRPSQNVYARAWVTRVAPSPALALQLTGMTAGPEAEQQRALAYATAGIWYDAVASLNQAQNPPNPLISPINEALQARLDQIGLPSLAAKK